jgi:hypothetical protein
MYIAFSPTLNEQKIVEVVSGTDTSNFCVIWEGGRLGCWGEGSSGQLGVNVVSIGENPNEMGAMVPVFFAPGTTDPVAQVATYVTTTCGI